MKPSGPHRTHSASSARAAPTRRSTALKLVAGIFFAVAVVAGGWWFWTQRHAATLPQINLAHLDPAVAGLMQKHLAEVKANPRSAAAWGKLGSLLRTYSFAAPAFQCLVEARSEERRVGKECRC